MSQQSSNPSFVEILQNVYGGPIDTGFGSAVFYSAGLARSAIATLESFGLEVYQTFCGELWERFGEAVWMAAWTRVHHRVSSGDSTDKSGDIVSELRGINHPQVHSLVPMLIDEMEDVDKAKIALASAFDAPEVRELCVYTIGDSAALSGILIASERTNLDRLCLVLLLD